MINKDLRVLMEAAGISTHARGESPREVLLKEVVPLVERMRRTINDVVYVLRQREDDLDGGMAHERANEDLIDRLVQVIDRWIPKGKAPDMTPRAAEAIVDLMLQDAEMRGLTGDSGFKGSALEGWDGPLTCTECGSLVPRSGSATHLRWHDRVGRAVR
jgi:hypothetical protein